MKKSIICFLIAAMLLALCGCGRETMEGIISVVNEELGGEAGTEAPGETRTEAGGDFQAALEAYNALSEADKVRFYDEISGELHEIREARFAAMLPSLCGAWRMEADFRHDSDSSNLTLNEDMTYEYGSQTGTWYYDEEENRIFFVNGEDGVIYYDFTLIEEDGFPKLFYDYDICYVREGDYRAVVDQKYVTVWGFNDASEYFGQPVYVGTRSENVGYGPNAKLGILDSLAYDNGLIYAGCGYDFQMELSWIDKDGSQGGQYLYSPFERIQFVEGREVTVDIVSGAVFFVRAEYVEEILITEDNRRVVQLKNGMFFEDYNFTDWDPFPMENYDDFIY